MSSHFTVRLFSVLRALIDRVRRWVQDRPWVAAWIYPAGEISGETDYRVHNGRMFAGFHEQERMLADRPRMAFYQSAITQHIRPGDRVIDLGTGTGILAALAARRGAAQVYAIDHSEILAHARDLAAANRVERVEFIATHSTAFTLPERVDVILHEQMGDCLFDESMVANVADLRDRLLKPGGLILPSLFDLYCVPIKVNDARLVPFIWELEVHGYDYASLERHRPQNPSYYHLASTDRSLVEHFLCEPEPVLSIDLHTLNEGDLPKELRFKRRVVNAGRFDGYAVYFRARTSGGLSLSSNPRDPGRAPHWGFRILRNEQDHFAVGDEIDVRLSAERWSELDSWRWSHVKLTAGHPAAAGVQT